MMEFLFSTIINRLARFNSTKLSLIGSLGSALQKNDRIQVKLFERGQVPNER